MDVNNYHLALTALLEEDTALLCELLGEDPDLVNRTNGVNGYSLLEYAVAQNNIPAAQVLLDFRAPSTPKSLCLAVDREFKNFEMAQLLVDSGANVDREIFMTFTPLVAAIVDGNEDGVQFLLRAGANPNAQDGAAIHSNRNKNGIVPLVSALHSGGGGNLNIVRLLVEAGADVNGSSTLPIEGGEFHSTVLCCAIMRSSSPVILGELLRGGLNVNAPICPGSDFSSPLHLAAHRDQGKATRWLLQNGANPTALDAKGRTPLALACEKGNAWSVYAFLRENPTVDNLTVVQEYL